MKAPSADQIQGFFLGMQHALVVADGNKRGHTSAQVRAISAEITRMQLEHEIFLRKTQGNVQLSFSCVEPQRQPTPLPASCTRLEVIGEAIVGAMLVGAVFIVPWVYLALTGEPINF